MDLLLLIGCGLAAGVTTVLFGFGGGFVAVPVVAAFDRAAGPAAMHVATATSAAVMAVSALAATVGAHRAGLLDLRAVAPLLPPIAVGACLGGLAAGAVSAEVVRVLFAVYLLVTIADLLLRPGFARRAEQGRGDRARPRAGAPRGGSRRERPGATRSSFAFQGEANAARRRPRRARRLGAGLGIGGIASLLGVGGSVMTVPAMRRRGHSMASAAAAANPLTLAVTLPVLGVAMAGPDAVALSRPHVGAVDLVAAGALLAGALPTIALLRRHVRAIPDRLHARAYVALLLAAAAAVVTPLVR